MRNFLPRQKILHLVDLKAFNKTVVKIIVIQKIKQKVKTSLKD